MSSAPAIRYSREDAERALALVRPVVEEVRTHYLRLRRDLRALQRLEMLPDLAHDTSIPPAVRKELSDLADCLRELRALGGVVLDPEIGLLTLPGRLPDGRRVHFCWKLGETRIRSWYGAGESYADRRPFRRTAASA